MVRMPFRSFRNFFPALNSTRHKLLFVVSGVIVGSPSRMTDEEVHALRENGIYLSTPDYLQTRLDRILATRESSGELGERLIAHSPFQSDQRELRSGKFWFVSHPFPVTATGVLRLLRYWGGEVASFHTQDHELLKGLERIGRRRVLEISVPIVKTKHEYLAAEAVLKAFARSLGCKVCHPGFGLYVFEALPSSAVINIHTEGDPNYSKIGKSYPTGFDL